MTVFASVMRHGPVYGVRSVPAGTPVLSGPGKHPPHGSGPSGVFAAGAAQPSGAGGWLTVGAGVGDSVGAGVAAGDGEGVAAAGAGAAASGGSAGAGGLGWLERSPGSVPAATSAP